MNPETTYFNKIGSLKAEKEALLKIKKRFSFIRLGAFVFTIIATYQLLLLSVPLGIAVLICFAAVFVAALLASLSAKKFTKAGFIASTPSK